MRLVLAAVLVVMGVGCAHGLSNEARLDAETTAPAGSSHIDALRCRDGSPEVQLARDAKAPKGDRLARYDSVLKQVKETQEQFDEEFRRDPDLVYGAQADGWKHRQQLCTDLMAAFERERKALQGDVAPAAFEPEPVKVAAPGVEDEKPGKVSKVKAKKDKLAKAKKRSKERLARAD